MSRSFWRLLVVITLAVAFGLLLARVAWGATPHLQACETIANSLQRDWESTQNLFQVYGPGREGNPIIRVVGPDIYFGTLMIWAGRSCRETPAWRWAALGTWVVQTWAYNTHGPLGTASAAGPPLLIFTVRW